MGVQGYPYAPFRCLRESGSRASIEEIVTWLRLTREQVIVVIEFAARSLDVSSWFHQ